MSNPWSNSFKEIRESNFVIEDPYISLEEKKNDGNLANNYPPYDKVTRGDVIAGAKGEDQMGGKKKEKKEKMIDVMPSGKRNKVKISPEMNEENIEERIDIKKQSSKRKSLGRGSSIKDGSKKTGYESPKEFRDAEKKFSEEFCSWVDNVVDEGYDISEYTLSEIVDIFDSQYE